jgi:hypothetical protein
MKTIIAGTRTFKDPTLLWWVMDSLPWYVTEVVSGCAPGADHLGEVWAMAHNVPIMRMPAEWKLQGIAAGPLRNQRMALWADAAVIFWDGESRGTKSMIELATARKLKLVTHIYTKASAEHFPARPRTT